MADSKVTALNPLDRFTLLPTDVTVSVDISDTTMAASGTDFKVQLDEFVASGVSGALGMMLMARAGMLRFY